MPIQDKGRACHLLRVGGFPENIHLPLTRGRIGLVVIIYSMLFTVPIDMVYPGQTIAKGHQRFLCYSTDHKLATTPPQLWRPKGGLYVVRTGDTRMI